MNKFVFTCGDINGIGPEICIKALNKICNPQKNKIYFVCPSNIFHAIANKIKTNFRFEFATKTPDTSSDSSVVSILDFGKPKMTLGRPTLTSGKTSFKAIKNAFEIVQSNRADAMITAPISKAAFELAGINFPGHTELLAELANTKEYVMTFISEEMNCALPNIHVPIKNIPKLITKKRVKSNVKIVHQTLVNDFKVKKPKIALLGLNPHAGENGRIGNEEKKIITPAINELRDLGIKGPYVPDAFFANKLYKNFDMVIGMYHDQVLIPFKMLNFNLGVNYTAGLPIVRTSPDHGTAFDIAGKNIADYSSIIEAFKVADSVVTNRKAN